MSTISKKAVAGFLVASSLALGVAYAAPGGGFYGHERPMMRLRGLDLTEAQRDQVFKIFHEQQPAMREQMKAIGQARRDLAQAATGDQYDANRVQAAAEAQGKAVTQLAVLRAQTMQRVSQLLTPEQRAKVKERLEARH
ncbi:MAG TPA: Spy/CpxP family protein refolding chaperone [Burkholderiales bacterium]|jgi:Spy/CpxP family protein refolding chaperone|nr:Spy/CpxP family protein refolding chaperone [Burkholderiales bacterium]